MMRRIVLFFTAFILGFVAIAPKPAHAGLLEFFFPMLKMKGETPIETLKAPFADDDIIVEGLDASGNRENASPLDQKHRTNDKMTEWLMFNLPDLLVYDAANYRQTYPNKIKNFSKIGAQEYVQFLRDSNILKTLQTGAYDVAGFIKDYPVTINEGSVDNRYRWVYRMTIMVTYLKAGVTGYKDENLSGASLFETGDAINSEWEVTFQIGRSREAPNDAGVFFETWTARKIN